jgi:DNA-binding transcriptional regulator PaaX
MAHEDGTIVPEEILPVAQACGQTPEQIRSCLRRLVTEGLFVREGSGRDTRYVATGRGMAELGAAVERTRLAYAQDAAGRGWDRQWRLVAFAVPERDRAARDAFRDRLLSLGGAAIQGGLYVSPHPWHKEIAAEAERLGILDAVTVATTDDLEVGGERDPRRLAARLWPVDDLAKRYEIFVERFGSVPAILEDRRTRRERLAESLFLPGRAVPGGVRGRPVATAGAAAPTVAGAGGPRPRDQVTPPRAAAAQGARQAGAVPRRLRQEPRELRATRFGRSPRARAPAPPLGPPAGNARRPRSWCGAGLWHRGCAPATGGRIPSSPGHCR